MFQINPHFSFKQFSWVKRLKFQHLCSLLIPLWVGPAFAAIPLPAINTNNIVNVASFGAVGDGVTVNTTAIQNAINAAAAAPATNGLSGGTVRIPSGTFMCGPLSLKTKVNLFVDAGATLKMLPFGTWPGATTFINGPSIHDVEISGAGTIDGNAGFGSSNWWGPLGGSPMASRPNFIQFSSSTTILIQDITLQNPPTFHVMIKNNNVNITVQNITINTPGNSPNTDGFDIASTNVLIKNCFISDGDDIASIGGSQRAAFITITNCTFGTGHGISMGSITSGGVSNVTVTDCTFNGTEYGIRLKSDDSTSGSGSGGLCQNLSFLNLTMTNITESPIVIYSYYSETGTPTSITPQIAATEPVPSPVPATTVIWRNVTFSNLTASVIGNRPAGIIWGRIERPATNIFFYNVNLTAAKSFDVYNASGVQFVDSQINITSSLPTFELFNAQITLTNTSPSATPVTLDGLTTNGLGNNLLLYNTRASLLNTNVLDDGPLTLAGSTLTISNNLVLVPTTVLNYTLNTNAAQVAVVGDLTLGGINNLSAGAGFTSGAYTLLTYTGQLHGNRPTLGTEPAGFTFAFDTNTAGQINLIVTPPLPAVPANFTATPAASGITLNWSPAAGAASYNLQRSLTNGGPYQLLVNTATTNYPDLAVTNGVTYYYVVTATNSAGESAPSLQASAAPLPPLTPPALQVQVTAGQLQFTWPQNYLGWKLQMQTNPFTVGLSSNWITLSNSGLTNQVLVPIDPAQGAVFVRLISP